MPWKERLKPRHSEEDGVLFFPTLRFPGEWRECWNTRRDPNILDPNILVTFKELLMSEVIQSEALFNLLEKKGIVTKQELLEEIKRVKSSLIQTKAQD